MTYTSEWQFGSTLTDDGTRREHIAHLRSPRFTARVARIDPFQGTAEAFEGDVNLTSGYRFEIDSRTTICEIDWLDETPEASVGPLLMAAADAYNNLRSGFMYWKTLPPVVDMLRRVKLDIGHCRSWRDYLEAFRDENDRSQGGLVKRIRNLSDVVSTGEVPVLMAMLHAAGYSLVADEIGGEDIWSRLNYTYAEHARAAALPIMRV